MRKRFFALVTAAALALSMIGCGEKETPVESSVYSEGNHTKEAGGEASVESGIYTAGTYTGEAVGYGGTVSVTITTDANNITDVKITGDQETPAVGGAALETLAGQIKEIQSAEIDGVSGATLTSNAAREGAAKAIAAARGERMEAAALTPGTYTATKEGYQKEHVTVSVTVDANSITDVQIVEVTDHPSTITDAPCRQIPAAILVNQTYNVDGVTGATFTSNAIRNAVRDCLEQAGGSEAFSGAVEKVSLTQGEDAHTDILVVGGGAAGMVAAADAYSGNNVDEVSGLKVMLIEKAGFLGGSTSVSGGCFYTYEDESGGYDEAWRQNVVREEIEHLAGDKQENFNEALLYGETGVMARTLQLLNHAYATFTDTGLGWLCFDPPEGGEDKKWAGSYMTKKMNVYLPTTDIDVRLETGATDLLMDENGAVIGVAVKDKTSTYNIYAGKVILACGGFGANKEMTARYAPDYADALVFCAGTNTGDGIAMAVEAGAGLVGDTMFTQLGVNDIIGIRPDFCMPFIFGMGKFMGVNLNGERFMNEYVTGYNRAQAVAHQDNTTGWGIVDSDNENAGALGSESDLEAGYVFVADTLEELAEKIGIPADKLVESAEAYNAVIDSNGTDPFGNSAETMDRLDTAPYYGWLMRPCTITSLVAVKVDDSARVLDEDGQPIENLFAAGDMVLGNLLKCYNAARGVGNAIYSGDLAAQTAKAELQSK